MVPTRKSRSMNKMYSNIGEVSPSKDGDSANRSKSRKRKLADMLGPQWTMEELTRFYDAYRKHGKDWKKVAGAVKNRSSEMVEAIYTMNRAYLSLPHGTASAAGLIAMMTDHCSNFVGSDSDQESNDGGGSNQKTQKRARGKVLPATSKASDEHLVSHSQTVALNYGCLSLLKKKRSGGSKPRPVGKRTPRFPISFSYVNIKGEKYFSPTRPGLKKKANTNDDEVAHEIAIALAEVSQRHGSPQVSQTPSKRAESIMSLPFRHAQRQHSVADIGNAKSLSADMDEEDFEGHMEANTVEWPCMMESVGVGMGRQKGRKVETKKFEVDNNNGSHMNDIKEECSETEEDQRLSAMRGKLDVEVTDAKISRSSMQSQRRKSKKVLFGRDEGAAFDALQTLADLSLMMQTEKEHESGMKFKDKEDDHVDECVSLEDLQANQKKEKCRSSGVRMKRYQPVSSYEVASSKTSKPGKRSALDTSSAPEENHDPHQIKTRTSKKKQKMQASKVKKIQTEAHPDIRLTESPGIEAGDAGKTLLSKRKESSHSGLPKMTKISEISSSDELRKEGSSTAQSPEQVPVVNQVNLPTRFRSRRKMNLKKLELQKKLKFPDNIPSEQSTLPFASLSDSAIHLKEKLSHCMLNQHLRQWCTYECFYSAIDYPWFAKQEFVEYLCHVGLGHVPRLTRVEWGVIRGSLGKPRRFSEQFLKEEKEKLNQYRDTVRKHYTELREGVREGLPTDLSRPLSVGQRVIAIHPKTREIHDGSILTVDHSRCRVQFDHHELGIEFVMDIECMPANLFENIPALLGRDTVAVDRFFENFNSVHGLAKEYVKLSPGDNLDYIDVISHLSPLANHASLFTQKKVASINANGQTWNQQIAYSQSSTLTHMQGKDADVQALAELTCALDKKEAVVLELRQMNDDVLENQKDGESSLKSSEPFKKQYAEVLVILNEANEQVSSALLCLRDRNTYQENNSVTWPRAVTNVADHGVKLSSFDHSACQSHESGSHVKEIMDSSRLKARTMVDSAKKAISSLKGREDSIEKIEEAIDYYINDRLPSANSPPLGHDNPKSTNACDIEAHIPSDLITKCVATLLMIQNCTERQFPPSDVAEILDSAVTSLHPRSSRNLAVYNEILKCMGIIRNQILALIPFT